MTTNDELAARQDAVLLQTQRTKPDIWARFIEQLSPAEREIIAVNSSCQVGVFPV